MTQITYCKRNKKPNAGMTLLELLVVIVVIGTLTAIAYPNYTRQVLKSHRASAKSDLILLQLELEETYNRSHPGYISGYNFALIDRQQGYCAPEINCQSDRERFEFGIKPLTQKGGYILTATAMNEQQEDLCKKLEVLSNGKLNPEECW